jgi:hypothetical protein
MGGIAGDKQIIEQRKFNLPQCSFNGTPWLGGNEAEWFGGVRAMRSGYDPPPESCVLLPIVQDSGFVHRGISR